jgi:hypothetical protein
MTQFFDYTISPDERPHDSDGIYEYEGKWCNLAVTYGGHSYEGTMTYDSEELARKRADLVMSNKGNYLLCKGANVAKEQVNYILQMPIGKD